MFTASPLESRGAILRPEHWPFDGDTYYIGFEDHERIVGIRAACDYLQKKRREN